MVPGCLFLFVPMLQQCTALIFKLCVAVYLRRFDHGLTLCLACSWPVKKGPRQYAISRVTAAQVLQPYPPLFLSQVHEQEQWGCTLYIPHNEGLTTNTGQGPGNKATFIDASFQAAEYSDPLSIHTCTDSWCTGSGGGETDHCGDEERGALLQAKGNWAWMYVNTYWRGFTGYVEYCTLWYNVHYFLPPIYNF